jgi:hypothetical protein
LLSSLLLSDELSFLQKVKNTTEGPNPVLDPIIRNVQTGTVIADFFVPYICCSDCPPVQYMITAASEPESPAPVADAGSDQIIELATDVSGQFHASTTLDGSGSQGSGLSYDWKETNDDSTVNKTQREFYYR